MVVITIGVIRKVTPSSSSLSQKEEGRANRNPGSADALNTRAQSVYDQYRSRARLDSESGTNKGVQGSIEALSWLTAWHMIAAPIRRRISLI